MDLERLIAAQLFKEGSIFRYSASPESFLAWLNASTVWLSAGSFFLAGSASWLVCHSGTGAGAGRAWTTLTRVLAVYQLFVGMVIITATVSSEPMIMTIALLGGMVGTPVLAALWVSVCLRSFGPQR